MFSFGHTRMLMSAALTVWTNNSMLLIVFLVWYVLFSLKAYRLFQWTLLFDHWVTEPTIVTSCNHQDEGWVSFTKEFLCFKHKFANCKCAHNNFQIWTLRAWSKRFSKCNLFSFLLRDRKTREDVRPVIVCFIWIYYYTVNWHIWRWVTVYLGSILCLKGNFNAL